MQVSEGMRKSRRAATASSAIGNATEMKRGIDMTGTIMSVTTKGMTRGTAMQMKKGLGGTGIADLIVSAALQGIMTETVETRHTETEKSLHDRHQFQRRQKQRAASQLQEQRPAVWGMLQCLPRRATQTLRGRYLGMQR